MRRCFGLTSCGMPSRVYGSRLSDLVTKQMSSTTVRVSARIGKALRGRA